MLLDTFLALCEWTRVYFLWRPNLKDESDNHLIELAVAGDADVVVTRNLRDLRGAELRFEPLRILSPEDFLKEL
jgi:predicted nucleic acid-binding protein